MEKRTSPVKTATGSLPQRGNAAYFNAASSFMCNCAFGLGSPEHAKTIANFARNFKDPEQARAAWQLLLQARAFPQDDGEALRPFFAAADKALAQL